MTYPMERTEDQERRYQLMKRNMRDWLKDNGFREWLQKKNTETWQLDPIYIQGNAQDAIRNAVFNGIRITKEINATIIKDTGTSACPEWLDTEALKVIELRIAKKRKAGAQYIRQEEERRIRKEQGNV
jgi:uncharacterized protein with NAD-binding domain and iron-sulfur cluster